jgi:hypothetical protein
MDAPPDTLHGIAVGADATFVDRTGTVHHLVAAGPHLRCLDHGGSPEHARTAAALAAIAQSRACERLRVAWQRVLLADDHAAGPALRGVPHELTGYLAAEIRRHSERLDEALGPDLPARERRRWHEHGWRAAPSLARAYLGAGVGAGTAFVALRRGIAPEDVPAALADPRSPLTGSMRSSRLGQQVQELDVRMRATVTDDFPYEPL